MATFIPSFPEFDVDGEPTSVGPRWEKWLSRFENMLTAMSIDDSVRQKALLLHLAGSRVYEIAETLNMTPANDETNVFKAAKDALTLHFKPKKNIQFETYVFRSAKQEPEESLDQYQVRLRTLAKHCEFADADKEILAQIIQSCNSNALRRRALRNATISLPELLDLARTMDLAERQAMEIENKATSPNDYSVNAAKLADGPGKTGRHPNKQQCFNCGGAYPHDAGKQSCPAYQKTCYRCSKKNHFSRYCRQKSEEAPHRLHAVHAEHTVNSNEKPRNVNSFVFVVNAKLRGFPHATILVNACPLSIIIDSGAAVNVLDTSDLSKVKPRPNLHTTQLKIYSYGTKEALPLRGCFEAEVRSSDKGVKTVFYVVDGHHGSLLSCDTALKLGLLQFNTNHLVLSPAPKIQSIIARFPQLFNGIGKLRDYQIKLHIDKEVTPVAQKARPIPFHMRAKVEAELEKLLNEGIIEPASGATPWISPVVVAMKPKNPDEVRLCVDMRWANRAVKRERHPMPGIDDIIFAVNGSNVFSKLDLRSGYHQVELHPESRYITTFATHQGLFRYKRLNFGISSASECFQNIIRQLIGGVKGALNISDDILVYGRSQEEHDRALNEVLNRLSKGGLTLNASKCEFNKDTISFFGHFFSREGVSVDPSRVKAIQQMKQPTNISELRSFLGMVTYCARYVKNISSVLAPLRQLLHADVEWSWLEEQQHAFKSIKDLIVESTTLAYFDPCLPTVLITDAGPDGLGAVLAQISRGGTRRIIAFASRVLTDTEKRYSQLEKEMLGVVYGCEHFRVYLCGAPFRLIIDNKPLEQIFSHPGKKLPIRLERWSMRLLPYSFQVEYISTKDNPADYLSRHPKNEIGNMEMIEADLEAEINLTITMTLPKAMTREDIRRETQLDEALTKVIKYISNEKWPSGNKITDDIRPFYILRDELSLSPGDDMVLRGSRIVLPTTLRVQAIQTAHEGHQGIVKTKAFLRTKVWFPGIDLLVEKHIGNCTACQIVTDTKRPEPLKMSPLPSRVWTELSADFYGPLPSGGHLLVIIDDYSRFPVVEFAKNVSADSVIPIFERVFSTFGTPEVLRTDNGAPFQSQAFKEFSSYM